MENSKKTKKFDEKGREIIAENVQLIFVGNISVDEEE